MRVYLVRVRGENHCKIIDSAWEDVTNAQCRSDRINNDFIDTEDEGKWVADVIHMKVMDEII